MSDSKPIEAPITPPGFSYLQLYWIAQSLLYAFLLIYTYLSGADKSKSIKTGDKTGWFEFRKRRTRVVLIGVVWLLYLSYKTIGSYCFGVEQSELVRDIGLSILQPRVVNTDSTSTLLALLLFLLHCSRRLYENLRVSISSHTLIQGPITAALDHVFYVAVGVSIIAEGPLLVQQPACISLTALRWYHLLALVLFFWSSRVQWHVQQQLPKLRRNKSGHIVTTQYKQPKDGWFETLNISSPQYFTEILIYLSIGLALGCGSFTWALLCICLTLHKLHQATRTHRYYTAKFDDYPKHRNIIIPFIL